MLPSPNCKIFLKNTLREYIGNLFACKDKKTKFEISFTRIN